MTKKLTILKLGGAAITDKNTPFTARPKMISQIMTEVSEIQGPLIVIHGAGSFAHTLAKEYQIAHGLNPEMEKAKQLQGVSKIRSSMQRLHQIILDTAEQENLLTFSLPISSTLITQGQKAEEGKFFLPFLKALEQGFIPISYGDMCFDVEAGFLVVSGDRIIQLLVEYFEDWDVHVIFGSDVDGLYNQDPNESDNAKLIPAIQYSDIPQWLESAGQSAGIDVTGGMTGKLLQIQRIAEYASQIDLINITKPGYLDKAISKAENYVGTRFHP